MNKREELVLKIEVDIFNYFCEIGIPEIEARVAVMMMINDIEKLIIKTEKEYSAN